jgi:hypothetical protein
VNGCGNNPLNGDPDIYREVPLGKAMAGIGLTIAGVYSGALCEGIAGDDTAGLASAACGWLFTAAVNTGLTALGGKWDAESITMDVVSTGLEGIGSTVGDLATSEAATGISDGAANSRAIRQSVNMGVGSFVGWMNYAANANGSPTLAGSALSLGLGALTSYQASGWADLFQTTGDLIAASAGQYATGGFGN